VLVCSCRLTKQRWNNKQKQSEAEEYHHGWGCRQTCPQRQRKSHARLGGDPTIKEGKETKITSTSALFADFSVLSNASKKSGKVRFKVLGFKFFTHTYRRVDDSC